MANKTKVTTKSQNRGIEFCPICPTPQGRHGLQVFCQGSEVWSGDGPFEQDSYLRTEPFLVPFNLFSPKIYTKTIRDYSGVWAVKEDQPRLTEISISEMARIWDDDERFEKELGWED